MARTFQVSQGEGFLAMYAGPRGMSKCGAARREGEGRLPAGSAPTTDTRRGHH